MSLILPRCCALLTDDSLSLSLQYFLAFNAFVMMARGKKKEKENRLCENTAVPSAHTAYCTFSSHFLMTIPPNLRLCGRHHQLILYLVDEVAYLSAAAAITLPASLCGHLKSICETPKSLALHPLMRESTWQRERRAYLCMKC